MGWLALFLLVAATLGGLRFLGVRGGLLTASAAALLLGASGYALQGRPALEGAPVSPGSGREALILTDARHAFFGHFTHAESWIRISEALARRGKRADAVGVLQNAVRRYPGDAQLWIGLGNALVEHSGGLTPPAELAYKRAAELVPGHSAAPFFYGLAMARSGDREGAVRLWNDILAKAPADAKWRPLLEQGVAALSRPRPGETAQPPAGS
ncbi:MAG TPA: tetratricopeptide repeat protein [Sphingomicrobium sp.]|nr:tetratricopeptide repeat protein [Sphingomicrobium sp.]